MSKKNRVRDFHFNCPLPGRHPLPHPMYPNPMYPNQNQEPKIVFQDKEFLKVKRELELTDLKQQLFHVKRSLKLLKKGKEPKMLPPSKKQRKANKLHQEESYLLQEERVVQLRLRIKELKKE